MPPSSAGRNVRKVARYAGKDRDPLHLERLHRNGLASRVSSVKSADEDEPGLHTDADANAMWRPVQSVVILERSHVAKIVLIWAIGCHLYAVPAVGSFINPLAGEGPAIGEIGHPVWAHLSTR